MARIEGTLKLSSTIEPRVAAPLDARSRVSTLADLTAVSTFPYAYQGMEVYVENEKKKYMLVGDDPTNSSNWTESGGSGKDIQVEVMPTASASEVGNIYQYVGETNLSFTKGYFYECVSDGETTPTYSWKEIDSSGSSTKSDGTYEYKLTNQYLSIPVNSTTRVYSSFIQGLNLDKIVLNKTQVYDQNGTIGIITSIDDVYVVVKTITNATFENLETLPAINDIQNKLYRSISSTQSLVLTFPDMNHYTSVADVANYIVEQIGWDIEEVETSKYRIYRSSINQKSYLDGEGRYIDELSVYKEQYVVVKYTTHYFTDPVGKHLLPFYYYDSSGIWAGDFKNRNLEQIAKISDIPDITKMINIFTGTQAEWDALTTEEKLTYKQVNITDDESSIEGIKEYIRNQNILSGIETVTLPMTAPYDGELNVVASDGGYATFSINGSQYTIGSLAGMTNTSGLLIKKGDNLQLQALIGTTGFTARYYKLRDYTGR